MKNLTVLIFILIFSQTCLAETFDTFIDFQSGMSDGSTFVNGFNVSTSGIQGQFRYGWKAAQSIRIGLVGLYENLTVKYSTITLGTLDMLGYGGVARIFLLPKVFAEGMGGQTKATLRDTQGSIESIGYGSFYTIGSGVELALASELSVEAGFAVRNVLFPKKEFDNTRSLFFSAGLSFFF